MKINAEQRINMLAIDMLEHLGFNAPTQAQINHMEEQLTVMQKAGAYKAYESNNLEHALMH